MARPTPVLTTALIVGLATAVLAAPAHSAGPLLYNVGVSGTQELSWKVDGTTPACESRRGSGSGTVKFRFHDDGATPTTALAKGRGMTFAAGVPSTATGSISGAFTDSLAAACPGNLPAEPSTLPTTGCGATKFGIRVDAQYRSNGFLYVTGPNPMVSLISTNCPFPMDFNVFAGSFDWSSCGEGRQQWQRSFGLNTSQGEALLASRIAVKPRAILHPRRSKITLTGSAKVDCTVPSRYSAGVHFTGKLTYTLTARRVR